MAGLPRRAAVAVGLAAAWLGAGWLGAGWLGPAWLGAAAAPAVAAELSLRVEGRGATLYEGSLSTVAAPVDGGDGSGPHDCNAGASAAAALAASGLSWGGTWNGDFRDFFLDRVGPDASDPQAVAYWSVLVDWRYAAGICRAPVRAGGEVLLAYGPGARILRLDGPGHVAVGEPLTVSVRDGWIRASSGADGGPVAGASVGGAATGADGRATLRFASAGRVRLKATAPDAIRSNALEVCVGDATCVGDPSPSGPGAPGGPGTGGGGPGTGQPGGPVAQPGGTEPAALTIDAPAAGARYARGGTPTRLRGDGGPGAVAVTLAGRAGGRCVELTGGGTTAGRPCTRSARTVTVAARDGAWSQSLSRALPPGRYQLVVRVETLRATRRFTVATMPADASAARRLAVAWLGRVQGRDGGFGATAGATTSPLLTDWAAIALGRAAGRTRAAGRAADHYTRALPAVRAARRLQLSDLQRGALALTPSRARADEARLRRLRAAIVRRQREDGSWGGQPSATAYALLALRGGGRATAAARRSGARWLRDRPLATDADTVGATLWALGRGAPRAAALARLRAVQADDGGFAGRPGETANAQSTALAVIGMEAAGIDAATVRGADGISGLDYLRARQRRSGQVDYAPGDPRTPVWVTAQALLAFAAAAH
ncbi:prenyltransferase/squalene oxidase repeat-containing protein [Conexibacter woesei]|uniref:Squalene cyclase C-terminal domain-containing protein n=1 Tax=Conexibacter woesei (strain DSM 14684 / CCUG 47730 / CIP 108061 / JCM 11494 / NBRC 100937 / ID131577) TaxID=469383 RepID=D3F9S9_CONWI|nr:hypothetical protein [Conexibacter woesei]ADB51141.1 hypothetical protein Cwoe_2722 [Conexibacter woesei DSM 14684]